MEKIRKEELAHRLGRAIEKDVGMEGLNTLLYGWVRFRKYGKKYRHAIQARNWLYITEVQDLSDYAGHDLTEKSS